MTTSILNVILAVLLLGPVQAFAQEVEFIIPTEIDIIPGRLSVTFEAGTTEDTARRLIDSLGYRIHNVTFQPLTITGTSVNYISDSALQRLESRPEVLSTRMAALPVDRERAVNPDDIVSPQYRLAVTFAAGITQRQAREIVSEEVRLHTLDINARPNEIVIDVGEQDEEAVGVLEVQKIVRRVTYVAAPGF